MQPIMCNSELEWSCKLLVMFILVDVLQKFILCKRSVGKASDLARNVDK